MFFCTELLTPCLLIHYDSQHLGLQVTRVREEYYREHMEEGEGFRDLMNIKNITYKTLLEHAGGSRVMRTRAGMPHSLAL